MEPRYIKEILTRLDRGKLTPEEAYARLKSLPYQDLGFAKFDHHRTVRTGFPEVVFCPGKSVAQIRQIMKAVSSNNHNLMATRATPQVFRSVKKVAKSARYYPEARIISIQKKKAEPLSGSIAVVTAGTADIPVAEEAAVTAELLGCTVDRIYDVGVAGLHRLLGHLDRLKKSKVIIVIAGMEGALASVVGGLVDMPVIAVPARVGYGANFEGLSALLSMLNSCSPGVSVVNIDNGFGAACLAQTIIRSSGETR